jgi:predicted MFS family arabinose efflux permease
MKAQLDVAFQPLSGSLRRTALVSEKLALFVVTSAACALAPDPAILVAARVAQGVGAALMHPTSCPSSG